MILRRVIKHFRHQEWTAIFLDFVIVVVGVFVGLQVTNWNATRGDRATEIGYLEAMENDIVFSIDNLEELIKQIGIQETARAALYAYSIDPNAKLNPAERDRYILQGLFQLSRLGISQTTFESLKSAGRLGLIKSPRLISELQAMSSKVANALANQADEGQVTYLFSDPLLLKNFEMDSLFQQVDMDGKLRITWLPKSRPKQITPEVMKTTSFRNVILYRSVFTISREETILELLVQHRQILTLIDKRQADLGVLP